MTSITVVGGGLVGTRVVECLQAAGVSSAAVSSRLGAGETASSALKRRVCESTHAVVLAGPSAQQRQWARALVRQGISVVSTADAPSDIEALRALDPRAHDHDVAVVVGAAASPGLSTLLAASLARSMDTVHAVDVAVFGTGGPACARRHHQSFRRRAVEVREARPMFRTPGSSRRLVWFPDPIGAVDCYFAALADPMVIHRTMPGVDRVQARVAATRRDRLTARLPMLRPPHAEGRVGGLVVEARGTCDGSIVHRQLAVATPLASIAAVVAAKTALALCNGNFGTGVSSVADAFDPQSVVRNIAALVPVYGFDGSFQPSHSAPLQAARKWVPGS